MFILAQFSKSVLELKKRHLYSNANTKVNIEYLQFISVVLVGVNIYLFTVNNRTSKLSCCLIKYLLLLYNRKSVSSMFHLFLRVVLYMTT